MYKKICEELRSYSLLKKGWDGYEGITPRKKDVMNCLTFLERIKTLYNPLPMLSADGEVSLYWDNGNSYIEVGFLGGTYSCFIKDKNEVMGLDDIELSAEIPKLLLNCIEKF